MDPKKDPSARSLTEMGELVEILRKIDFIRYNPLKFENSDLIELAQHAKLVPVEPMTNVYNEGELADTMFLVMQGSLVVTYSWTEGDEAALYWGHKQKDINPDGYIKGLIELRDMQKDFEEKIRNSQSSHASSEKSGGSRCSKSSRGSRNSRSSRNGRRSKGSKGSSRISKNTNR